jgi:hypothetical protein
VLNTVDDAVDSAAAGRMHEAEAFILLASQHSGYVTKATIVNALRRAGTPHALIIAKLISKGKLKLNIEHTLTEVTMDAVTGMPKMRSHPHVNGSFDSAMPNRINIYTNGRMDIWRLLAQRVTKANIFFNFGRLTSKVGTKDTNSRHSESKASSIGAPLAPHTRNPRFMGLKVLRIGACHI